MVNMGNFCFIFRNLWFFYTVRIVYVKELQNEVAFRMYFVFENVTLKIYNNLIGCSLILPTNIYSMPTCLFIIKDIKSHKHGFSTQGAHNFSTVFTVFFFYITIIFSLCISQFYFYIFRAYIISTNFSLN